MGGTAAAVMYHALGLPRSGPQDLVKRYFDHTEITKKKLKFS